MKCAFEWGFRSNQPVRLLSDRLKRARLKHSRHKRGRFCLMFTLLIAALTCSREWQVKEASSDLRVYLHQEYMQSSDVKEPACMFNLSDDSWLLNVRIQKTGSKMFFPPLTGSDSGQISWSQCTCQGRRPLAPAQEKILRQKHGSPCSSQGQKMQCIVDAANSSGTHIFWHNTPHVDWKDLEAALNAAGIDIHEKNVHVVTSLREPISRVVSEFHHVLHDLPWDYVWSAQNGTLLEFAECIECSPGTSNRMTRMLAGVAFQDWEEVYKSEGEMLVAAKRNLQLTKWFAIYERPAESNYLLRKTFPEFFQRLDQNSDGSALALNPWDNFFNDNNRQIRLAAHPSFDTAIELIAKKNSLDLQLYSFARDLFERRLHAARNRKCAVRENDLKRWTNIGYEDRPAPHYRTFDGHVKTILLREIHLAANLAGRTRNISPFLSEPFIWDLFPATGGCMKTVLIGKLGDGGKVLCDTRELQVHNKRTPLRVYSFGISTDISFETDLLGRFRNSQVSHLIQLSSPSHQMPSITDLVLLSTESVLENEPAWRKL